jgi:hypothetical protein
VIGDGSEAGADPSTGLGKILDTLADHPEFGDFLDAARARDEEGLAELTRQLARSREESDVLQGIVPRSAEEEAALEQAQDAYYGTLRDSSSSSETDTAPWRTSTYGKYGGSTGSAPWRTSTYGKYGD